ncbi:MAG: Calx-beta domain-containing protein [Pyrinomonadaceae bacterium]
MIDNNSVATVARGIAVQGSATTVFPGLAISNNTVGNPALAAVDQVYSVGITAQGSANGSVSGNTVYIESFLPSSTSAANRAIDIGGISAIGTFTVERNMVNRVTNNAPDFWVAHGINIAGGTNHIVRNNFVSNVTLNTTSGGFYSTTFNAAGIRIAGGTGHQIYHNSVNMNGTITGATPAISAAFMVTATTVTGLDVRNNIFVNSQTNGSATSAFVSVYLPSGATSAMNLTLNNNDYWNGAAPTATQGVGQVGTVSGTGFFTQANFDPTVTTPATNFRSYTSTLSAAGTNDNATKKVDPQFVSGTDLHIAVASPMVDAGAAVGVAKDIDSQNRVPPPDIGADEPSGVTPPANDIAATAILVPAPSSSVQTGVTVTPQATFTNVGSATQTNVGVRFTITGPGGFNYLNNQVIPSIAPNQTIAVVFGVSPTITTPGAYVTTALVTTPDSNAANDSVTAGFSAVAPLTGIFNVGTGGDFTSLTNPGGIFDALNAAGASGNVTINIISDLTGETGTVALNEIAGGFTVLLKPTGAARSITGSSAVGIIRLNGADGVTIDGSLSGGSATGVGGDPALRNLTVQNTNTAATAGAVIVIQQGANQALNDTIKNVIVSGQDPTQTLIGIHIGGNAPGTSPTVAANNNAVVDNCAFQKSFIAIFNNGVSTVIQATGSVISHNDISATGANRMRRAGIFFFSQNGIQVTDNKIGGIVADEAADAIGIIAGVQNVTTTAVTNGGVSNALISRNRIDVITSTNTTGFSAAAIAIAGDATGTGNVISNNMISGVNAPSTSPDITAGIFVAGVVGSNTKLYHNTISMTGDRGAVASQIGSYGVAISGTNPIVELKNNIFYTTQTSGGGANAKSYAIGMTSATFSNLNANFNDYFSSGANAGFFRTGSLDTTGTDLATLAAWQTATAQDAGSFAVDPLFVDPIANPHLQSGSPMINTGTVGTGVTNDIDGDTRDATPDIGADEFIAVGPAGTLQFSSATYTVTEAGPVATITVTRTGGSNGIVGASYATVAGGTATGGAACGAGIDYVNTSGTVSFGNGVTTAQTFDIPMCDDAPDKVDETVNLALTLPTGGATLGTPNTAVLTITDNDPAPTISINDVTLAEGNAGTTMFTFNVTLSAASGQTVSVHYATADGTATLANNDYQQITDTTLTFNPGQFSLPVTVLVNGDTAVEPNETFFVNLTTPTNATILDAQGQGNITNDDVVLPGMSIGDARITEGNSGTKNMTFTVTFNGSGAASARYHTTDGTAQAVLSPPLTGPEVAHGDDYVPEQNGIIGFGTNPNPEGGAQTQTFNIIINGDTFKEPNEFFTVTLDQPMGATITRSIGFGVIVDEDRAYIGDIDNDKKTDFTVFRPSDANWYTIQTSNNNPVYLAFGISTDKPVPGDYDGDGKQDYAVRRPGATNEWWYQFSSDFSLHLAGWGVNSDLSVQADYDGDDKTDVAVFRNGTWFIYQSSNLQQRTVFFGQAGDIPVPGDFDGDGKADFTVFRNGTWYTLRSSNNTSTAQVWGQSGDKPMAGDFDGDGRYDLAVYRSGTWHILNSLLGTYRAVNFGLATDLTVPGDYDGDGTTDVAVFRPSTGDWHVLRSSNNSLLSFHWGLNGDIPIPSAYQP